MKKDMILLDTVGEFALLYGFENLNEKAYWAYSTLSPKMIVLTNTPRYSGNCYSLYVKKVNDDYSLVSDERFYEAIVRGDLEGADFIWVEHTSSYICIF